MKGIIYKATNTYNGKVYIGQTVAGLARRKAQHYRDARADSNFFHLALYQFPNGFIWEVLDEFVGEREYVVHALNVAEEYQILKHKSNNESFGYNSTAGGYSSDKFAERIKREISRRNWTTRPVAQYDMNGDFVNEFPSANEAERETGVRRKTILSYCKLKSVVIPPNSRSRFVWRFSFGCNPRKIEVQDLRPKKKRKIRWKYNSDGSKYPIEILESTNVYKEKMEHRIIQYTLDGEFVKVWDNAYRAAESGADGAHLIRKCLTGEFKSPKLNYQWVFYTTDYPQNIGKFAPDNYGGRSASRRTRMDDTIEEVSYDGTVIATYRDTADAAEKSGFSQAYICNVLAGRIKHPKRRFRRK